MRTTWSSRRYPETMCGEEDSDDNTVGRQKRRYRKNPMRCWRCLHALGGRSRYWTAQPSGSYRFLDYGNHAINSPWEPTLNGPPITPGAPCSRFDLNEPPHLSVRPSQHARALLRLPVCYGIQCLAHAALAKML